MNPLDAVDAWQATAAAAWSSADGQHNQSARSATPFALASVTKPLFTYAVLIAIEEGSLSLAEPAGPSGSTVRHLLSHASGLDPDRPTAIASPATRRIYSNAGFELLGDLLEVRTGFTPGAYLDAAVLQPLAMHATSLTGSPAHSAISTVDDLLRFTTELLSPTLLHPDTLAEARSPQFSELNGVLPGFGRQTPNLWGLGFELRGHKHPHWTGSMNSQSTFGHFGRAGTMLWVDPDLGLSCVALSDHTFGPWAVEAWPKLSDAVITLHNERQI